MTDFFALLAATLLAIVPFPGPDPLADLADSSLTEAKRLAAVDRAWAELEAGTAGRAETREALKKLVWTIGRPGDRVRIRAIDKLLLDSTPEGAADTINLLRLRLPTETAWPVLDAICNAATNRASDPAWRTLTAALVRSYARKVPTPPDEDRPERGALLALHPESDLATIVFGVFVDPAAHGSRDGEYIAKARQAAWELLGRLDQDGSRRAAILAAHSEWSDNEAVAELFKAREAFGIVPVTGSELDLARRMLRQSTDAEKAWWAQATAAIGALTGAQRDGLQLRHLEPIRWASEHRREWAAADRATLLSELSRKLNGRRMRRASTGDGGLRTKGESLRDWQQQLAWGDVLAILVIDEALREPAVVSELFAQVIKDRADESTEYGGLLWAAESRCVEAGPSRSDQTAAFRASLFEPRPTQRKNDRTFIAPEEMFAADARALAHYHFHVQVAANAEYASPGRGDHEYADLHGRSCLVLTSVREGVLNADYYQRGGVVIDLGEINARR